MRRQGIVIFIALLLLLTAIFGFQPKSTYSHDSVDVSWPNCTIHEITTYQNGIIGANGGLDFRPNPCLNDETHWFTQYSMYMNTGYPGSTYAIKYADSPKKCSQNSSLCLAYNYGYQAAEYTLKKAGFDNAHTNFWWLDVETDNSWTNSIAQNRIALKGMIDAIKAQNPFGSIGFYASPGQWTAIVGIWQNGFPVWLATGSSANKAATEACISNSFTGGKIWLTQYTAGLDHDIYCKK